jgi:two-component system LytT family response regulator
VLLDIQMPELDGFGVLRLLGDDWHGRVVFATAHDRYAVGAFEQRALDYVLKPVRAERLADSIDRLRAAAGAGQALDAAHPTRALAAEHALPPLERVAVSQLGRTVVVPIAAVEWIEAEDNYVRLHCGDSSYLLRGKLTALEARLDALRFMRVHRSHIVQLACIHRLDEWTRGGLMLVMRSGRQVEVSRGRRKLLMDQLSL